MDFQLVYRSEAFDITEHDVRQILRSAQRKNTELGVTGCLVHGDGFFIHIIEGERDKVEQLFYTIEDDKGHGKVTVLHKGISTRAFDGWRMAFHDLDGKIDPGDSNIALSELEGIVGENSGKSFSVKVFWYNVQELMAKKGFYSEAFRQDGAV